jgi:hypothetical protein
MCRGWVADKPQLLCPVDLGERGCAHCNLAVLFLGLMMGVVNLTLTVVIVVVNGTLFLLVICLYEVRCTFPQWFFTLCGRT